MTDYRLHHGDCVEELRQYAGQADLILTSPPYDNLRDYGGHVFDFDSVADACVKALKPGGVLVWIVADATVDGSETGTSFRQALGFLERGLHLHDTMIYAHSGSAWTNHQIRYMHSFEYMFILSNGKPATINLLRDKPNRYAGYSPWGQCRARTKGDGLTPQKDFTVPKFGVRRNVWEYVNGFGYVAADFPKAHDHPAIFPYTLAADHIRSWTNEGDLVIDPMAGSGTTVRAAVNLGRRAVGIDIHEPYVDLMRQRMAQQVLDIST